MAQTRSVPNAELSLASFRTHVAECEEFLQDVLDDALIIVDGSRAFIALVDTEQGELEVSFTAGPDWTEETRRFRLHIGDLNPDDTTQRRGITSYVVATGEPYWTGNVSGDPHYIKFFDDVRSEIAVPIIESRSQRTVGVLNVESTKPDAFNQNDCRKLQRLAQRSAIGIAMAEHQVREEALVTVGKELSATANVNNLMQTVVQKARRILRADDCSVFMVDESGKTLTLSASHGLLSPLVGKTRYTFGEGLTGWIAEHGEPIRIGDPREDPRWKGVITEFPPDQIAAYLGIPIFGRDKLIGVLRVVRRRKGSLAFIPHEFTDVDEEIFKTLSSQLAVALVKARLIDRLLQAERMAAWGELSARSAHMIGNALFGVKGDINELKYIMASPSEDVSKLLEDIQKGIGRLEHILEEFRDFVRATQLTMDECSVNELVQDAVKETFPKRCCVRLQTKLQPDLPPILADPTRLKRAFGELIENSIDFQPDGGVVEVETSLLEGIELNRQILAPRSRKYVMIVFSDKGPGLTLEEKEKAFTSFFTKKSKGLGMGLSIVKGIVDAHHGLIREVGDAGIGARFEILLPAKELRD